MKHITSRSVRRGIHVVAALVIAASMTLSIGPAKAESTGNPMLGIVPRQAPGARHVPAAVGAMTYHNGPIMKTTRVHLLFWDPTWANSTTNAFPANYVKKIDKYFNDVAADSGKVSNVYSIATQYDGPPGQFIKYKVTNPFVCLAPPNQAICGTQWIILTAYPTGGCPVVTGYTACVTKSQMEAQIEATRAYYNPSDYQHGMKDITFLFFPEGVDSCSGSSCASNTFCAFHSWVGTGDANTLIYANEPYNSVPGCAPGEYPNNNAADDTINTIDHEHNEAITDPVGTGWYYGSLSGENGDQCNFDFTGEQGPAGAKYNQKINGRFYHMQTEWSNNPLGCRKKK